MPLHTREALALLERTLESAEPCSAWASITHRHMLGAIQADGHRDLLSGLGSDEVFAGYSRLLEHYFRWRRHNARWPVRDDVDALDALLWDRNSAADTLYPGVATFFSQSELSAAVKQPYRNWSFVTHLEEFYRECRRIKPRAHMFELMVAHECQRRVPDLLFVGFESVARELGVRTTYPFLDVNLLRLVSGLGPSSRYHYDSGVWWNKMMLRRIAAERVPATIVARSPSSYTAPFAAWLREPAFARPTIAKLKRSRFFEAGLVRRDALTRILTTMTREPMDRRGNVSPWVNQLWALLTLASWYDRYVERRP